MKLLLKMLVSVGVVLLFTGCTGNTPKPLHQQQKVVRESGGKHYYVPVGAQGFHMNKKLAYLNNTVSSGLLQCKKDYALVQTQKASEDGRKYSKAYYATLTPSESKVIRNHPTSIPRKDAKEFRKIVEVSTKAVRNGEMYCIPPMSQKQVKQYKAYQAQQAKINNDPRVIAARANQSAAMMNYQAATATKNVNYNVNHSGYVNYTGSVYHY